MPRTKGTRRGNGAGHGVGSGPGWGGPAKGFVEKPPAAYTADSPTRGVLLAGPVIPSPTRAAKKALREARAQKLEDILFEMADDTGQPGNVRVAAASRLHAIYEGQPVARVINHSVDDVGQLSDAALRDELARLGGAGTDPAPGNGPPAGEDGPSRLH